jgi:DNA-directed RNA polymerase subunit M/transcription elongation factor TFIIS
MEKTCIKCGHTHSVEKINSQSECPKCGVIYTKAEEVAKDTVELEEKPDVAEQDDISEIEHQSNRKSSIINFLVIGCAVCLLLYLCFGREPAQKYETAKVLQAGEQITIPEPDNTVPSETLHDDIYAGQVENEENSDTPANENEDNLNSASMEDENNMNDNRQEKESEPAELKENNIPLPMEKAPAKNIRKEPIDYYMAEANISSGKEVSLDEHISDRGFTVFYFYAEW